MVAVTVVVLLDVVQVVSYLGDVWLSDSHHSSAFARNGMINWSIGFTVG